MAKTWALKCHSLGEAGLGQSRHYSLMKLANETGLSVILQAIFQGQSPHQWSLTHVCLKRTFHWGDSLAEKGGREPDHVDSWKDEMWKQGSQSTHAPPHLRLSPAWIPLPTLPRVTHWWPWSRSVRPFLPPMSHMMTLLSDAPEKSNRWTGSHQRQAMLPRGERGRLAGTLRWHTANRRQRLNQDQRVWM